VDQVELLRRLQGDRSQTEFAELLGLSQPLLSMVYSGQRRLGREAIARLLERFPEQQGEIVRVFLRSDYND